MNETINIIQFMPYFPPHKWWVEMVGEEISYYWVKSNFGNCINIVTHFDQFESDNKIIFQWVEIWYKRDKYEVLVVPSFDLIHNFPIYKIWSKKYKTIMKYMKTKNLNKEYRVITHTRFFLTSLIGWLFAKNNNIEWIHIEHWSNYVLLSNKIISKLSIVYDHLVGKYIFRKADKVLAISSACKKFIVEKFVDREVDVFYRGIKVEQNTEYKKKGDVKIVYIGRLVALKWVKDLLNAYKKSWITNEIVIIWDGEEKKNLKNRFSWPKVTFLWYKSREYVIDYLKNNKCLLVNPSYSEGMPTTVIEALITQNVVVATNVWGTSEITSKWDLVLYRAWDIEDLGCKMITMIDNYDDVLALSRDHLYKTFDRENNIKKLYLESLR